MFLYSLIFLYFALSVYSQYFDTQDLGSILLGVQGEGGAGATPLVLAIFCGQKDIADIIINSGADVDHVNQVRLNCFVFGLTACKNSQPTAPSCLFAPGCLSVCLSLPLFLGVKDGSTPLIVATACNKPDLVEILIKAGANLDYVNTQVRLN